jgi:PAS domain S-box-containing protein
MSTLSDMKKLLLEAIQTLSVSPPNEFTFQTIDRQLKELLAKIESPEVFNFEEIGDHLYDGVYLADGKGLTLYVNKSYERITGIRSDEIVGRYVQDVMLEGLYSNAVTPEVLRLKKRVDSVGQSSRNGARMLVTGNPIFDQYGNVKLVAVIEREITDLDTMLIELEATKDKIRGVEAANLLQQREIKHLRHEWSSTELICESHQIREILALVRRVADFDVTILIQGETGVGKEVIATEIHKSSVRKDKPFIRINCAAIPATLLESELFGYEKGAYTGASIRGKTGLFELADKGTILLDEIGDMPLELQGKLLRVLQDKELTRVGGTRSIPLDVRVIASTNCDLQAQTQAGKFRTDLFFRLNVFPITIPPLREHIEDIEPLTRHFLHDFNLKYAKKVRIGRDGLDLLLGYVWPGNVRELQNVIERLVLISDQSTITSDCLTSMLYPNQSQPASDTRPAPAPNRTLREIVNEVERSVIEEALNEFGSTRKAAKALGIDQSTIVKKAKRIGLKLGDEISHQ